MKKYNSWGEISSLYVDEYDNPVERTKDKYPYTYDGFVVYRLGKNEEITGTVYSDRMLQWDWDKYNKCTKEVFGDTRQMFYDATPSQIEALLQLYFQKPTLKLILMMEYCNVSNGYPVWRFDYKTEKDGQ